MAENLNIANSDFQGKIDQSRGKRVWLLFYRSHFHFSLLLLIQIMMKKSVFLEIPYFFLNFLLNNPQFQLKLGYVSTLALLIIQYQNHYMTSNEQFQQRIALLNEYAQCLQKQNKAKSLEIAVLHGHLGRVDGENQYLRGVLDEMRNRFGHREKGRNISCSLQTSINLDEQAARADACCQTNQEEEKDCIDQINQVLTITQRINEKDATIVKYHRECEEMFEAIEKLQTENQNFISRMTADKDIMNKLEERLRREEQKRSAAEQRLEDASYNIYNAGEEVENYKRKVLQCESDLDSLILENNSLIERIRGLQREKNQYYHEIKRMSRVSFGNEPLQKSAVKKSRKVSDQRFRQIEEHLRKVQMENQAIQSNLMISR